MIVWLASYPRSGNTFFRVILNSVFDIKTYSIYDDIGDIGADEKTTTVVGHTLLPKDFDLKKARSSKEIYYIKTHELLENMVLEDSDKVIYLVRDGRESTLSFTKYLKNFHGKKNDDLTDVIYGDTPYGSWGEHVRQWQNVDKLLIKFEALTDDPSSIVEVISKYLNIKTVNGTIPTFEELHTINPEFFRSGKKDSWKEHFSESEHLAFWLRNVDEMLEMGYTDNIPDEVNKASFQKYVLLFQKEIDALKTNTFKDRLVAQKIKIQEEKIKKLNAEMAELDNAINELKRTNFIKHPIQKYKNYKKMITTYEASGKHGSTNA